MKTEEPKTIRCAIYTRKSTEEGREQDFTSLDAQRESAENYIASQKQRGWIALTNKYNDYGFTGANMERPALKQLINDIKNRNLDCVVVYKVDRLSRSLMDFANLLSLFDEHNVTFVSVTQHFNTDSSMGRLTLNILLSFSQFEREIISERTSDKMGAARRKGKFIGGRPALGYQIDKENRKLLIIPEEAEMIKNIFHYYIKHQSLLKVVEYANSAGYRSKRYMMKSGPRGGNEFNKNNTLHILRNRLYTGKVVYKGEVYDGEHEAIIPEEIFETAQNILSHNRRERRYKKSNTIGLLSQRFRCKACDSAIIYTYTKKGRYHYNFYVCSRANKRGYKHCPTKILSAQKTEDLIVDCLREISLSYKFHPNTWENLSSQDRLEAFQEEVDIMHYDAVSKRLEIILLNGKKKTFEVDLKADKTPHKRPSLDDLPSILRFLLLAYQIQELIDEGRAENYEQISKWTQFSLPRVYQIMNFLLLSPKIQEYILLSNDPQLFNIPEHKIRPLFKESEFDKQIILWKELLNHTL